MPDNRFHWRPTLSIFFPAVRSFHRQTLSSRQTIRYKINEIEEKLSYFYLIYSQVVTGVHIFFSPVLLQNRGEIRTLHPVKELLSFYYAGSFLYEKTPRFFCYHLIQRYDLFL
jgi:hypothetical protein